MSSGNQKHSAFLRLLAKHDPAIRGYIRASIPTPTDVAEIMQNVSIVAWDKFSNLENAETDFCKWAHVIARYEILKFRRGKARDRLVLDSDIIEKMAHEGEEEADTKDIWLEALENCLAKLPQQRRDLLLKAYNHDTSMKDLASQMNKKPNALYQLLSRLRVKLVDCVQQEAMKKA